MKKRNWSIFTLVLMMAFIFAVPVNAVQPHVYLEPGTQLEAVVPSGEVTIVIQDTGSDVTAIIVTDGAEEMSPRQTPRQIECCHVNTPIWVRGRVYSNGVHIGYIYLRVCAGCGRGWSV